MNRRDGLRIHMGCGEPLNSRWRELRELAGNTIPARRIGRTGPRAAVPGSKERRR